MSNVLITGGTGFIGSHIVEAFCQRGISPVCLIRKESTLSYIRELPMQLRYGDITNLQSLIESFKGIDFVIHVAAYVRDWGSYKTFSRINVEGTKNVLMACVANGIKDVIITSSISVYGEEDSKVIKDEKSALNSHYPYFADRIFPSKMNYYRDTKASAKKMSIEYAKEKNLNLTVLEPVWVYGEREFNTGFFTYLEAVKKGVPFVPGSKKNTFPVVYAGDVAHAYWLIFSKKLKGIHSFIIGDRESVPMNKIYELFCREAGFKKPLLLPWSIAHPIGFSLELIYTILRMKSAPPLTRARVNLFYDTIAYSSSKAREVLGFSNSVTLEEGIKRTVSWYKKKGFL